MLRNSAFGFPSGFGLRISDLARRTKQPNSMANEALPPGSGVNWASVAVSAAAAVPAGAAVQLFRSGQSAQFKGFVDVLMNGLLNLMKFFLGIHETPRHRVFH